MRTKIAKPWRVIIGTLSIAFIVYMWAKKDIVAIYATTPKEQIAPLIATTIAVSLAKVGLLAGVILLIKWIIGKIKKN